MVIASHTPVKLSFFERVGSFAKLPVLFVGVFLRIIWILPARYAAGWPFARIIVTSLIYVVYRLYNPRQRLSMQPPTGDAIRIYASKEKLNLKTSEFQCEGTTPAAALHELDVPGNTWSSSEPDKILLWFHGGGYSAPLSGPLLIPMILKYAEAAKTNKAIFLEYTIAPGLKYPGQLVQAVAAIRHLLLEKQYDPSQIILGTDSAGGNLALALLAHILQPSPYAKPIEGFETLSGKAFKGLLMLSPMVTPVLDSASYRENNGIDVINVRMMRDVLANWEPKSEIWSDFLLTTPGFWDNVPVENILVTAGNWESFRDDIVRFGGIMGLEKKKSSRRRLVVGEKEIHDQPAMDGFGGLRIVGTNLEVIEWLKSLND